MTMEFRTESASETKKLVKFDTNGVQYFVAEENWSRQCMYMAFLNDFVIWDLYK